jgi:hypothetical protein
MAASKTSKKRRPKNPFRGAVDGVPFSKENQPSSEAKKQGWEQWRKDRHLTQSIIKAMLGKDGVPTPTFNGYIQSLINNAKKGNPKAIETINKCLEDDIIKVAQTDPQGNAIPGIFKVEIVKSPDDDAD